MKIPLAQYARLLLTGISVSVLAACGGGSGGSDSNVQAPPPVADFSAALVNGNCTELQLTSLSEAGEGTSLTDYKWDVTLTGEATQTAQGADVTTATFTLADCGSVAVAHTVTDSQGRSATVERTVDTAPSITDVTPQVATVNVPVTLEVTGNNLPATVVLSMADATCETPQSVTSAGFSAVCTALTSGSKVLTIRTNTTANGGTVIDATRFVEVASAFIVTATGKPHTGITANQCFATGGSTLLACSQPDALALNGQQDGHRASINAMGYSQVGSYPVTSCVKDNITGLIWEGKEASGTRAFDHSYTNYHSSYYGTQTQMDAATNTYGYVAAVNAKALCGYTDWRLPTADELQSIVDYSKPDPGPTINTTWFPLTRSAWYWSSSPNVGYSYGAWSVNFGNGYVDSNGRSYGSAVRLVRASQ
jgi:hypothetical protein